MLEKKGQLYFTLCRPLLALGECSWLNLALLTVNHGKSYFELFYKLKVQNTGGKKYISFGFVNI